MKALGHIRRLLAVANERGATAVEYGLMVGLIAAAIVMGVTLLGQEVRAMFESVILTP